MKQIPARPVFASVVSSLISKRIQDWLIRKGIPEHIEHVEHTLTFAIQKCQENGHVTPFNLASVFRTARKWPADTDLMVIFEDGFREATPSEIAKHIKEWVKVNEVVFPNVPHDKISFYMEGNRIDNAVVHVVRSDIASAVVILPGEPSDFRNRMYLIDMEEVIHA